MKAAASHLLTLPGTLDNGLLHNSTFGLIFLLEGL